MADFAAAQQQSQRQPPAERIRYGGDAAFAPFESLDEQGRPHGFQVDVLKELGAAIGVEFDIALKPWPDTEADFRAGRVDVVATVDTSERRRWARFLRGHAAPVFAIYHRPDDSPHHSLQDLVGQRVAVLDIEPMRDTLRTFMSGMPSTLLPLPTAVDALAAVRAGQADVALMPRAYGDAALAAGSELVASTLNIALWTFAFAVAPDRDDLAARLQAGLQTLEASGRLEKLRKRWLSSHREIAARAAAERGLQRQIGWTWAISGAGGIGLAALGTMLWRRGRRIAVERDRRREAEAQLDVARELLDRTFAHHPDAMLVVEAGSGIVRDANPAMLSLVGATAAAVIGSPLGDLQRHIDAAALSQLVESLRTDGALDAVPLRLRHADGSPRDCLVSAERMTIGHAPQVFCIVRDITEQLAGDATLRASYDALAAELEQSRRERDEARETAAQAVLERVRADAAKTEAEEARAVAEGRLGEYTRAVSHELKTPLNAVQGFAGLLMQRLQAGHVGEAIRYAEHIERAALRMASLINALARLAQVGRLQLKRTPIDMQRLAQDTWSLIASGNLARTVELRLDALPPALGDADLVAQVWQNLLHNAWKYTGKVAEPRVSVASFRDDRGVWYRVADNGDGFDMAKAKALFQPFQRMHAASEFEGTGVGLSLVHRIVGHHHGEIRVRSQPSVGTVVEFTLDAPPSPSAQSPAAAPSSTA